MLGDIRLVMLKTISNDMVLIPFFLKLNIRSLNQATAAKNLHY